MWTLSKYSWRPVQPLWHGTSIFCLTETLNCVMSRVWDHWLVTTCPLSGHRPRPGPLGQAHPPTLARSACVKLSSCYLLTSTQSDTNISQLGILQQFGKLFTFRAQTRKHFKFVDGVNFLTEVDLKCSTWQCRVWWVLCWDGSVPASGCWLLRWPGPAAS